MSEQTSREVGTGVEGVHSAYAPRAVMVVACLSCGYNLQGTDPNGYCPECGRPAVESWQGRLEASSLRHLQTIRLGLGMVLWGIGLLYGLSIAANILAAVLPSPSNSGPNGTAGGLSQSDWVILAGMLGMFVLIGIVFLLIQIGWWVATSSTDESVLPTSYMRAQSNLRMALAAVMASVIGLVLVAAVAIVLPGSMPIVLLGLLVCVGVMSIGQIVGYFMSMAFIAKLAERIPNSEIEEGAKKMLWVAPLVYVFGSLIIIGPLVALFMYVRLLGQVRKAIKEVIDRRTEGVGHAPLTADAVPVLS